jgi:hypothetical protein
MITLQTVYLPPYVDVDDEMEEDGDMNEGRKVEEQRVLRFFS